MTHTKTVLSNVFSTNKSFTNSLGISLLELTSAIPLVQKTQAATPKPNILFIAVDDLKPLMSAYGDKTAITPAIDKLAREGVTFQNTYCQQAISAATRASLLTGMRPDKTKVWDLKTDFRVVNKNAVSISQFFSQNGYETAATGKIFHIESAGAGHDAPSWTMPYAKVTVPIYAIAKPAPGKRGPATECADVPDSTFFDGVCAENGIKLMQQLKEKGKPFFLAVGFTKPHLPFVAPKKYWDLYQRNQFQIAPFQKKAKDSPDLAYHASGELKFYTDIPKFDSFSDDEQQYLSVDRQKELIHGYYAATSYMDAQLQKVLDELERLGLAENTIVVLWGDHGYHLGDHGLWNKHTDFEEATHVPLIIKAKGFTPNTKPSTQCELVDVFPTLCRLAGIKIPKYLDGVSLVNAMKEPTIELRKYAFSQYPRGNGVMGYTIRTKRYRYTAWLGNKYTTAQLFEKVKIQAEELYDYETDPLETQNVYNVPDYKVAAAEMKKLFEQAMKREHKQYLKYDKLADWK